MKLYFIIGVILTVINFILSTTIYDFNKIGKMDLIDVACIVMMNLIWVFLWPVMMVYNLYLVYKMKKGEPNIMDEVEEFKRH